MLKLGRKEFEERYKKFKCSHKEKSVVIHYQPDDKKPRLFLGSKWSKGMCRTCLEDLKIQLYGEEEGKKSR